MLSSLLAILTVPLAVAIVSFFVPARVAAGMLGGFGVLAVILSSEITSTSVAA